MYLCNIYWCSIKFMKAKKPLLIWGARISRTKTRHVPGVFAWNVPPSPGRCNILSSSCKAFVFIPSFSLPQEPQFQPHLRGAGHGSIIQFLSEVLWPQQKQTWINVVGSRRNWVPKVCIWRPKTGLWMYALKLTIEHDHASDNAVFVFASLGTWIT